MVAVGVHVVTGSALAVAVLPFAGGDSGLRYVGAGVGIVVGAIAGYFGGMVDMLISRVIEIVMLFPSFFLILTLVAFIGPLRACLIAGNQALTARAESYAALGRLQARIESWLETAGAVRANTQNLLEEIAEERGLDDRFVAGFFP